MKKNNIYTIPNFLSLYRLLMFPYILYLAITQQASLFAILLTINLITDVLDGLTAWCFNMQTELGARLDSIADFGTCLAGRKQNPPERKKSWLKYFTYFIITILLFACICFAVKTFPYICGIIVVAGFVEIIRLQKKTAKRNCLLYDSFGICVDFCRILFFR